MSIHAQQQRCRPWTRLFPLNNNAVAFVVWVPPPLPRLRVSLFSDHLHRPLPRHGQMPRKQCSLRAGARGMPGIRAPLASYLTVTRYAPEGTSYGVYQSAPTACIRSMYVYTHSLAKTNAKSTPVKPTRGAHTGHSSSLIDDILLRLPLLPLSPSPPPCSLLACCGASAVCI